MSSPLSTVDISHPPMHPDKVEAALLDAWGSVRNDPGLRVLKIIHGYGSGGRGGSSRDVVRNWAFRQRGRFRRIIYGEDYALLDAPTQEMLKEVGQYRDRDLTMRNPGITIIWVK